MRGFRYSLALAAIGSAAALPSVASGQSIYSQVLQAYQVGGQIPPCQFTSSQLTAALQGVDTYGAQYFADFTDAIQNALAARAGGACLPASARPAGSLRPAPASTRFLAPSITGPTAAGLPAPILVLAGLTLALGAAAGLAGLTLALGAAAGLAGLAFRWGRAPRWAAAARHGAGETGYRLADWWDGLLSRRGNRDIRR